MPVLVTRPPGVCRPCSWVAASSSPQSTPPPARAVFAAGSTSIDFRPPRSITIPPSQTPWPTTLCPPPRTATTRPVSRAKRTAAETSAVVEQRAISAGWRSIIALKTARDVS
jgi:hypothetical protein